MSQAITKMLPSTAGYKYTRMECAISGVAFNIYFWKENLSCFASSYFDENINAEKKNLK